ncbi:hypothetical protein LTR95_004403 [Oleoguttula sp. CCFEE 5521]
MPYLPHGFADANRVRQYVEHGMLPGIFVRDGTPSNDGKNSITTKLYSSSPAIVLGFRASKQVRGGTNNQSRSDCGSSREASTKGAGGYEA